MHQVLNENYNSHFSVLSDYIMSSLRGTKSLSDTLRFVTYTNPATKNYAHTVRSNSESRLIYRLLTSHSIISISQYPK